MDVQFGKPGTPERERFREEARTYVNRHAKITECWTSPQKNENNRFFSSVPASRKTLPP